MGSYLFGPISHTQMHALAQRFLSVYRTENIKRDSYDSLLTEVNHLMDSTANLGETALKRLTGVLGSI